MNNENFNDVLKNNEKIINLLKYFVIEKIQEHKIFLMKQRKCQ